MPSSIPLGYRFFMVPADDIKEHEFPLKIFKTLR